MSDQNISTPGSTATSTGTSGSPDTRLRGWQLRLARGVWGALALFTLGLLVFNLPRVPHLLGQFQVPCSDTQCSTGILSPDALGTLHRLGVPVSTFAIFYGVIFALIPLVIWVGAGLFLVWRKSDDWMALLVSLFLILFQASVSLNGLISSTTNSTAPLVQGAPLWFAFFYAFCQGLGFPVMALFPNGRFVPRWMLGPTIALVLLNALSEFIPSDAPILGAIGFPLLLAFFACLAGALIYRYVRGETLLERQQIKWLAFAIVADLVLNWIGPVVLSLLFPQAFGTGSLGSVLYQLVWPLTALFIPISIGIAILRYRLWDIDAIINKTLVYGLLTGILGALYAGLIIGLENLVGLFSGTAAQNPVVLVISTLTIAALFLPVRRRIQAIIDRRFYRRKYDAEKTLAAFSATLRSEVNLEQVREQLLSAVQETMQPAHVSLWLAQPERHSIDQAQRLEPS